MSIEVSKNNEMLKAPRDSAGSLTSAPLLFSPLLELDVASEPKSLFKNKKKLAAYMNAICGRTAMRVKAGRALESRGLVSWNNLLQSDAKPRSVPRGQPLTAMLV